MDSAKDKKIKVNEFALILAGFVFFLNPNISFLDVLPDFIGCALILFALNRLSPLSPDLETAFGYMKYLIPVSAARMLIIPVSSGFDSVMTLSILLVFAITEFGIAFASFPVLYDGLSHININYNGPSKEIPEIRHIGTVFFAARGFSSVLPYITSVFNGEDDLIEQEIPTAADPSAMLMTVNIVITVIFAVFFIVSVASYIGKMATDRDFNRRVSLALEEKKQYSPEYFLRKNLVFSLSVLALSTLFLIDIIGDGINYIPDFIFGITAVWAILLMRKYIPGYRPALITGSVYTVASAVNFFVYNNFMKKRFFVASFDYLLARFATEYYTAVAFSVIESVAFILFAIKLVDFLRPVATEYSVPEIPPEFVRLRQKNQKYIKNSKIMLTVLKILFILSAVSGTLFTALMHPFPYYWMIHLVLNITLYAFSSTVFYRFRSGVTLRYARPSDIF